VEASEKDLKIILESFKVLCIRGRP